MNGLEFSLMLLIIGIMVIGMLTVYHLIFGA